LEPEGNGAKARNFISTEEKTYYCQQRFCVMGLTSFDETFVQGSTFVLRMNSSAKKKPQRKASNR
jgi:hypothetical protein